jgi:phytoene dehydrogenase-like protein
MVFSSLSGTLKTMIQHRFKVVVVGGGVCGLATAVSLAKSGHEVKLLEQAQSLEDCGGSVSPSN